MSNFNIFLMTTLAFLAIAALFVMNFSSYFSFGGGSLSSELIGGSAVEHKKILYTLNFDQQNRLIDFINQSDVAKDQKSVTQDPNIDVKKIVFYLLENKNNIEIIPLNYDSQGNLFFSFREKIRKDTSQGKLKKLLSETYDN